MKKFFFKSAGVSEKIIRSDRLLETCACS